jgi:tetratricopeptide (TPR) repeat protein
MADFEMSFYEGLIREKPNYIDALKPLAELYTKRGDYEKGLEIDLRLSELCPEDPDVIYNLACSYALTGQTDQSFAALGRAIELGYRDFDHMKKDGDLKSLVGDPRFEELTGREPTIP